MMSSIGECEKASKYGNCKWCKFSTKCAEQNESCDEGCSTLDLKMTCLELSGIIVGNFLFSILNFFFFKKRK